MAGNNTTPSFSWVVISDEEREEAERREMARKMTLGTNSRFVKENGGYGPGNGGVAEHRTHRTNAGIPPFRPDMGARRPPPTMAFHQQRCSTTAFR